MQLYILRHGIAEDAAPGQPDSDRRLVAKGTRKLRKVLDSARAAGVSPEIVLTSPYVRAVETAEIAREVLALPVEMIETEALTPATSVFELWEEIRAYRDVGQLMVVGHNPLLEDLLCFVTGAPADGVILKKGALACIEVEGALPKPRGTLIWLLTAKAIGA